MSFRPLLNYPTPGDLGQGTAWKLLIPDQGPKGLPGVAGTDQPSVRTDVGYTEYETPATTVSASDATDNVPGTFGKVVAAADPCFSIVSNSQIKMLKSGNMAVVMRLTFSAVIADTWLAQFFRQQADGSGAQWFGHVQVSGGENITSVAAVVYVNAGEVWIPQFRATTTSNTLSCNFRAAVVT